MLELIVNPEQQRDVYSSACEWADQITLCLAWLEGGDAQGPSWDVLEPHLSKLELAIVGFGFMRSEPSLLEALYRRGALRVVSSTDGGFAPNVHVFRRGDRLRAMLASAPFSSTAHEQSVEALVVYEGGAEEAFALQALKLVERCRAAAHLPTREELEEYKAARLKELARTRGVFEAPLSMRAKRFHLPGLEDLRLVTDRATIERAMAALVASHEHACSWEGDATVKVRRESTDVWLHWVRSLGLWAAFSRTDTHYSCAFGVDPEDPDRLESDFELAIALEGVDPLATAAFAQRGADEGLYLVYLGHRHGRSVTLSPEAARRLGGAHAIAREGGTVSGVPIANVLSPELPAILAAFGRELKKCLEVLS